MAYKKIVQAGASGTIGKPIFNALVSSNKFEITVLARPFSSFTPPANVPGTNVSVKVVKADYSDHNALVEALKGHDALVITIRDSPNVPNTSKALIDAAIDAGIKRIVPSEYGADLDAYPERSQYVFPAKLEVARYLKEKAAEGKITWTAIATGPLFPWGLSHLSMGFDLPNKKVSLFNGGTLKFNTTTLESAGDAVVSILSSPDITKNKYLRIHDFHVNQLEILSILEEKTKTEWIVEDLDIDVLAEGAAAKLQTGELSKEITYTLVQASVYGRSSAAAWDVEDDSRTLGLQEKDLREQIQGVL